MINVDKSNLCRGRLRNVEAMVSQLILWFQNTNYLVKDHHIVGFETSIRLNQFLVQIHQSCLHSHTKGWRKCRIISRLILLFIKNGLEAYFKQSKINQQVLCPIPILNIFPSPKIQEKSCEHFHKRAPFVEQFCVKLNFCLLPLGETTYKHGSWIEWEGIRLLVFWSSVTTAVDL